MRGFQIAFGVVAAGALAACGGGSGGGGIGGSSPSVAGRIVSRDGSTVNLAGIVVSCVESGESDVSDGTGRFAIDAPVGESFRLKVDDPATAGVGEGEGDCTEGGDGDADEQDVKGDEVEIGALEDGESCDVEITIENGEIVCISVSKGDDEHEGDEKRTGEAKLFPPLDGSEARGEVEVGAAGECSWMEIEAGGLAPESRFEVFAVGEGVLALVAVLETNAEGGGHAAIESCGGDRPLPFGVGSVAELAGMGIVVKDALGAVVLEGTIPAVGSEDHHDGDDGKGDDGDAEDGDDGKDGDGGDDAKDGDDGDGDGKDGDGGDDAKEGGDGGLFEKD